MLKISRFRKCSIQDYCLEFGLSSDFRFSLDIAKLFGSTFSGYNANVYEYTFSDQSTFAFPVVRINGKLTILNSLPYSWKTTFHSSNEKLVAEKIDSILKNIKANCWTISFPATNKLEALNGFIESSLIHDEVSSYITPLKGRTIEQIFERDFSSKTRNQCRKALKSEMTIERSRNQDYLEQYFNIYNETSSRWNKSYVPYPFDFYKQLIELDEVDFWVSVKEDVFFGGIIVLKYDNWVYYWAGMTERKYSSLCANNGLIYEAIKYYCNEGYNYFDFGPSEGLGNVEKFKKGFGPETIKHHFFKYESLSYKYVLSPLAYFKNKLIAK
jgi:hypothetical protein